jgi:hypothetical protein
MKRARSTGSVSLSNGLKWDDDVAFIILIKQESQQVMEILNNLESENLFPQDMES